MAESLRDRQRTRIRDDIRRAAVRLFAERGFGAVTTEEIAAAAGVGHSTYFRYVANKEDLLLGEVRRAGAVIVGNLEQRPAGESAQDALHQAILRRTRAFVADEESIRHWRIAIRGAPQLLDRVALIAAADRDRLIESVAARMGAVAHDDIRPGLLVHTRLAAAEYAFRRWLADDRADGLTLHQTTERALEEARAQRWS